MQMRQLLFAAVELAFLEQLPPDVLVLEESSQPRHFFDAIVQDLSEVAHVRQRWILRLANRVLLLDDFLLNTRRVPITANTLAILIFDRFDLKSVALPV